MITQLFSILVSIAIVILNQILRLSNMYLIKKIGLVNKSIEISFICIGIFISQYINTGLILTLSFANWTGKNNVSSYSDFTHEWYDVVGYTYITTMMIQSGMPIITTSVAFAMLYVKRFRDSGSINLMMLSSKKRKNDPISSS